MEQQLSHEQAELEQMLLALTSTLDAHEIQQLLGDALHHTARACEWQPHSRQAMDTEPDPASDVEADDDGHQLEPPAEVVPGAELPAFLGNEAIVHGLPETQLAPPEKDAESVRKLG